MKKFIGMNKKGFKNFTLLFLGGSPFLASSLVFASEKGEDASSFDLAQTMKDIDIFSNFLHSSEDGGDSVEKEDKIRYQKDLLDLSLGPCLVKDIYRTFSDAEPFSGSSFFNKAEEKFKAAEEDYRALEKAGFKNKAKVFRQFKKKKSLGGDCSKKKYSLEDFQKEWKNLQKKRESGSDFNKIANGLYAKIFPYLGTNGLLDAMVKDQETKGQKKNLYGTYYQWEYLEKIINLGYLHTEKAQVMVKVHPLLGELSSSNSSCPCWDLFGLGYSLLVVLHQMQIAAASSEEKKEKEKIS